MPSKFDPEEIRRKAEELESASLREVLSWAWEKFGTRAAIGTSFQGAGLVVMNEAFSNGLNFPVFTIDTGLLFPETLDLKAAVEKRFGITIEPLGPSSGKTSPTSAAPSARSFPCKKNSPLSMSGSPESAASKTTHAKKPKSSNSTTSMSSATSTS
jgi:3'-phosphoadenosine 5'-phosphosulfate sulfotransferase (PAPS reductase)/FAD synthetase